VVDKDRFGNLLDPLKHKMQVDPSQFINLSSKTIMPVFNENSFVFFLKTEDFIKNRTLVHFEIYLNLKLAMKHSMDISRYLNQVLTSQQDDDQSSMPLKMSNPIYETTFANKDLTGSS
jgi:hypothetical protein